MGHAAEGRDRCGDAGVARRPGFFDGFKEIGALTKHLAEAQTKSTNPLIGEVAKVKGTGFGLTSSPQEIESQTIEALKSSMSTLKAKAPDDVQAYRDFVLNVAKAVAEAAKAPPPPRPTRSRRSTLH